MADPGAWWVNVRRDPWLIVVALLGLVCFAPFLAQSLGWWNATALQHDAASALCAAMAIGALGTNALFGRRRWPVSHSLKNVVVLAILSLGVASGIIAIVVSIGVLLGVLAALPSDALVLQSILSIVKVIVLVMRP